VTWQQQCTDSHHAMATAFLCWCQGDAARVAEQIGERAAVGSIRAHHLWSDWLGRGRVRKDAVLTEKR
jgi:hypothetical protein